MKALNVDDDVDVRGLAASYLRRLFSRIRPGVPARSGRTSRLSDSRGTPMPRTEGWHCADAQRSDPPVVGSFSGGLRIRVTTGSSQLPEMEY